MAAKKTGCPVPMDREECMPPRAGGATAADYTHTEPYDLARSRPKAGKPSDRKTRDATVKEGVSFKEPMANQKRAPHDWNETDKQGRYVHSDEGGY